MPPDFFAIGLDGTVRPCCPNEWAWRLCGEPKPVAEGGRQVGLDEVRGYRISTVFLGTPREGGMFESVVVKGDAPRRLFGRHCDTFAQALKLHAKTVSLYAGLN